MIDLSNYRNVLVTNYNQRFPEEKIVNDLGSIRNIYKADLVLVHTTGDFYEVHKDRYNMYKGTTIEISEIDQAKTLLLGVEVNGSFER